jgi:multidrug efflux pump
MPRGYFPDDDTGLIFGSTRTSPDISFDAMVKLQQRALEIVLADQAISGVGSSVGASGWNASVNQGRMFISLKPPSEREGLTTQRITSRLRRALAGIEGLNVSFFAARDIRAGARQGRADYQFTFWSPNFAELYDWVPKVVERLAQVPGLTDVSTDREQGGLQAKIAIDRQAAARLGVGVQDINSALNNAFSQRQISTIYTERNQYRIILEVDPRYQRDPADLSRIFVPGRDGVQVPLASLITVSQTLAPLVVNHQGPFPAVTVNYGLDTGMTLDEAQAAIRQAIAELRMPDSIRAESAGDARAFQQQANLQVLLIVAALLAVYIVLGVLYESLAHPVTIISTLPSAGLGALVALRLVDMELTVIAFIGIILLIGIRQEERHHAGGFRAGGGTRARRGPARAIHEACMERFRPIMMTTFRGTAGRRAARHRATGPGSELRRPLGVAIIGGLIVSQILTLHTTPVIYCCWTGCTSGCGRKPGTTYTRRPALPEQRSIRRRPAMTTEFGVDATQPAAQDDAARLARAKRRVAAIKGFYIHLAVFTLVLLGLLAIDLATGRRWWVHWVFLGWGIGIVAHAVAVFGGLPQAVADWEKRKIKELMRK